MPQMVVNIKVGCVNIFSRDLKNNRFKMRHAPYSNLWQQPKKKTLGQEN